MKTNIDMLEQIQKVDVPPFLLTRIKQKIANAHDMQFSRQSAWAWGLAFALVLVLNITVLLSKATQTENTDNLVDKMNLSPKNTLYR